MTSVIDTLPMSYPFIAQVAPTTSLSSQQNGTVATEGQTSIEGKSQSPAWVSLLLPLVLIVVFYFLLIRPQQKKEKQKQQMLKSLSKGDIIITRGGIKGLISSIDHEKQLVKVKIGDEVIVEMSVPYIDHLYSADVDSGSKK